MYNHSHHENQPDNGSDEYAYLSIPHPHGGVPPEVSHALESRGFVIHRVLGEGGFGKTYHVSRDGEEYAIKQLTAQGTLPRELFDREAEILGRLSYPARPHPQIPVFYEQFDDGRHSYIVQEFIRGQNLQEIVRKHGPLDEGQVRHVLKEVLHVLHFMHNHNVRRPGDVGFIHRDIKPANIMVKDDGTIVLVDFGVARDGESPVTSTRVGTPGFVAPEQANGRTIAASDIYGLGVTAGALLVGSDRFLFHAEPQAWQQYAQSNVSDSLAYVLDRMMEPRVDRRFHDVAEVLAALDGRVAPPHVEPTIAITPVAHQYPHYYGRREVNVVLWGSLLAAATIVTLNLQNLSARLFPAPQPSPTTPSDTTTIASSVESTAPSPEGPSEQKVNPDTNTTDASRRSQTRRTTGGNAKRTDGTQLSRGTEKKSPDSTASTRRGQQGTATQGTSQSSPPEKSEKQNKKRSEDTNQSSEPDSAKKPEAIDNKKVTEPDAKSGGDVQASDKNTQADSTTSTGTGGQNNGQGQDTKNVPVATVPGPEVVTKEFVGAERAKYERFIDQAYVALNENFLKMLGDAVATTSSEGTLETRLAAGKGIIEANIDEKAVKFSALYDLDQKAVSQLILDKKIDETACSSTLEPAIRQMQEEVIKRQHTPLQLASNLPDADRKLVENLYKELLEKQDNAFKGTLSNRLPNCQIQSTPRNKGGNG